MSQSSEPDPVPRSVKTAAISIGRFVAYYTEFEFDTRLLWSPEASGDVKVRVAIHSAGGASLVARVAGALRVPITASQRLSDRWGLVADLRMESLFEGARWIVTATVESVEWAACVEQHHLAVAA